MFNLNKIVSALIIAVAATSGSSSMASAEGYHVDRVAHIRVASWDHLNVRQWPASHSQKIGQLPADSTIWVQRCIVKTNSSDWCKVSNGHMGGWVNSKFLEIGEPL